MIKQIIFLTFLVLAMSTTMHQTSATTYIEDFVKITDIEVNRYNFPDPEVQTNDLELRRGENIDIELVLETENFSINDVEVRAEFFGYRYNQQERDIISDFSRPFDMDDFDAKRVDLNLEIPLDMQMDLSDDTYLVITVAAAGQIQPKTYTYKVNVKGINEDDAVQVSRASFSPDVVKAGFGFTALVRVENFGEDSFDDVCATVKVVGLPGVKDTECIDNLDADESESLEEFALRIPEDTEPGVYDVEVNVEFDKYQGTTYYGTIEVIGNSEVNNVETPKVKLLVNIPESLEAIAGNSITYPVTVTNQGTVDSTIVLSVNNVNSFATATFDPSNLLILKAGETKTVMLNLNVNADVVGVQTFLLNVEADGDNKQVALMTTVKANSSNDLRRGLEIGLIILVIILIILGLIVGFTRMKKNDGEEETQTYY